MLADLEQATAFLTWLRPAGPWVLTAISNDRLDLATATFEPATADSMRAWISRQNVELKRNVYYHVNPTLQAMHKKAELEDMAALEFLHVDVDPQGGEDIDKERARILELLQKAPGLPVPSAVIFSGGGYQALWRLAEPVPINGSREKAEQLKLYNLQIELVLGADRCHNIDRILRLPGTVNWPNEKKRAKGQVPTLAAVLEQHDDRTYPIGSFTKAAQRQDSVPDAGGGTAATRVQVSGNVRKNVDLSTLPEKVHSRVKVVITQGYDSEQRLAGADQSRSAWLMFVCGSLVRAGVDDDTIYSIITDPDYKISASVLDKGNSAQVHRYAVRQIKRAKEEAIQPELAEFNDKYALVESVGGRMRIAKEAHNDALGRSEVEFLLVDGFKTTHCNRFVMVDAGQDANGNPKLKAMPLGKWWLEHPERRTFETVAFHPKLDASSRALNLWRGFAYDAIPGDCSLFLDHLRRVLCRGDDRLYDYLIGWMANAVQNPHLPGQVAVVLRGKQGTGKGTFAKHFGRLFGVHYKHVVNSEHVTGKFNTVLLDAALVFADECFKTDKAHVSALKALITEDTLRVEAKGIDNLETRNCCHIIMATNEDWSVVAGLDDRRFFALDVPDDVRKDTEYFLAIEKQLKAGGYAALLHQLMTHDLSAFDVRRVPVTQELRLQQQRSMGPAESFWFQILEDGRLCPEDDGWTGQVVTDKFADRFISGYGRHMTPHQAKTILGMLLGQVAHGWARSRLRNGVQEWEDSRGKLHRHRSPAVWRFGDLQHQRDKWNHQFGRHEWPPIDDDAPDDAPLDGTAVI